MTAQAWGLIACPSAPIAGQTIVGSHVVSGMRVECLICVCSCADIFDRGKPVARSKSATAQFIEENCRSENDDEVWRSEYVRLNIIRL